MDEALQRESEKLRRSWMRHDAVMLRDYLVAEVEDPRINLQSILTRHLLVEELFGERFRPVQEAEIRFAAAMNWGLQLRKQRLVAEDWDDVRHALRVGADNAEGIEIAAGIVRLYASLPCVVAGQEVPNYLDAMLDLAGRGAADRAGMDLFANRWRDLLSALPRCEPRLRVLEAACGSANDYRGIAGCGLARLIDFSGFDLCDTNIANARALFPGVRFETGNVFAIDAPDRSFDCLLAHDLFEHLSPAGLDTAVREVCRVTRRAMSLGFFSMAEIPDHVVRPVEDYHWNTLSVERLRARFAAEGFRARVIHIGTFLERVVPGVQTHNPNAYTLLLRAG